MYVYDCNMCKDIYMVLDKLHDIYLHIYTYMYLYKVIDIYIYIYIYIDICVIR